MDNKNWSWNDKITLKDNGLAASLFKPWLIETKEIILVSLESAIRGLDKEEKEPKVNNKFRGMWELVCSSQIN